MGIALIEESKGHRVNTPDHLLVVLGRSASCLNASQSQPKSLASLLDSFQSPLLAGVMCQCYLRVLEN